MTSVSETVTTFEFPEIHNFPPFFTRQPNEDTWKVQRQLWCDLILAFYKHNRLSLMPLAEAATESPFSNRQIHRSLQVDTLREIIEELVRQGHAVWTGPKNAKDTCMVYWRKPEVWANIIHMWACEHSLCNTVLTLYELANGDDTVKQEFHGLDLSTLRRSLEILQSQGKAQMFAGTSDDDMGIKFFS